MKLLDFTLATVWCEPIADHLEEGALQVGPGTALLPVQAGTRRDAERRAVRSIIDHVLGPDAQLSHDIAGAPHIPGCHISISHSRRLAVVAFSDRTLVGVDAEEWRPALAKVASRFLSERERMLFTSDDQLLTAWTIKEAVYKASGRDAYEFAEAIAIAGDMRSASVGTKKYVIETRRLDDTVMSLAIPD